MNEDGTKQLVSAEKRLGHLVRLCAAMANALAGYAMSPHATQEDLKELKDQLIMNAKRASWIEKCGDIGWEKYDPTNAKTKKQRSPVELESTK